MTKLNLKHWQDPVNALIGVWLLLSPWALGFSAMTTALANAVIVGVLLIAAALGAVFVPRAWEEWTELVLGLWLIAAPWLLGFGALTDAMRSTVAAGVAVVVLSLWTLLTDKDYRVAWWRDRAAH